MSVATSTIVSYDVQSDARLQTIVVQAGAQLNFRTDLSTRVTVVNFMVLEGGQLQVGTAANPVAAGVTAEIVFANQALNAANDPNQYGNGLIAPGQGHHAWSGAVRYVCSPGSRASGGANHAHAGNSRHRLAPGDRLGLPDSRHLLGHERFSNFDPEWERSTIQSISPDGRVLTLTSPLAFDHRGARNSAGALEFLPHVGNLSRNVTIKSESSSGVRGHTFFTHRADVDIRYVAFAGLGRTTDAALNNANRDERFPVNFHHLIGPQTPQANGHQYTFVGNSIFCGMSTHNFKWGIAVNGSHDGLIKDNVLYNWKGAGIVTVDGSESDNVFEHNLVMAIYGTTNPRDNDGRDASGFWFAGYNNYVRDNVVAGAGNTFQEIVSGVGYKFFISPPEGLTDLTPILEFARNEAYGAMATGLTIWHLGTDGYALTNIGQSTIRDLRIWHAWEEGVFAYPIQNVVFDGLVIRGHSDALSPQEGGAGWTSGDYWAGNVTLRRADIQGMYTGFAGSSNTPGVIRIEDSYFRNYSSNISIQMLSTPGSGADKLARQTQIINTRFDAWPGAPGFTAIEMNYDASVWNTDVVQTDQVFVYDYNGIASDDFQVFYNEQRANFIVPQTAPGLIGSPAAGLTNQQNWAQFGIAIAGAVAPANATTRAGIDGLVKAGSPPLVVSVGPVSPDPRNTAVSTLDVVMSETINLSTFNNQDITLTRNGGGNLITGAVTVTQVSGARYRINNLSGLTGASGNYVLTVNAGGIQSTLGMSGTGSASDTWTTDTTAPTVTINQAASQADPASGPIQFTVVFSEAVTGFDAADLIFGGTAPGTRTATVTGGGTTYTVVVAGMTGNGSVTASVSSAAAVDGAGNSNTVSSSIDNTVTYQHRPGIVVTSADAGGPPEIRVFDAATGVQRLSFHAFASNFTGGVRVAMGDVNGDGTQDIIAAAGQTGGPHIRVFDSVTGQQIGGTMGNFFAYAPSFTGGVFVAAGDVNGDGKADVITAAGAGGGPHVQVFSGATGAVLHSFYAYAPNFTGGVVVAAGDLNADGRADIITGPGAGGGPHVRAFNGLNLGELASFYAYAPTFTGGVFVAAGDINTDGRADMITGAGAGGGPHVRAFNSLNLGELANYYAYAPTYTGGVRVSALDLDRDGRADIVSAPGSGSEARLRIFNASAAQLTSFLPYGAQFSRGFFTRRCPKW